jgi:hypothetical protein
MIASPVRKERCPPKPPKLNSRNTLLSTLRATKPVSLKLREAQEIEYDITMGD